MGYTLPDDRLPYPPPPPPLPNFTRCFVLLLGNYDVDPANTAYVLDVIAPVWADQRLLNPGDHIDCVILPSSSKSMYVWTDPIAGQNVPTDCLQLGGGIAAHDVVLSYVKLF